MIVGNGIAGISCARHVRKRAAKANLTVVSSETPHFFSRTALMYIYMGHMQYTHTKPYEDRFWKKNRITLCYDHVDNVDIQKKQLSLRHGKVLAYDALVLATGSQSRAVNYPGTSLRGIQGLYSYPDLLQMQAATKNTQQAVVVGGGLIGIELVEMLHTRHIDTTFLIRERAFWGNVLPQQEAELVSRHIREQPGVTLKAQTEVKSFEGDTSSQLQAIHCTDGSHIPCQFAGISIGVQPNLTLVQRTPIEIDKGVLVDEYLRTSVPDVYAIGDCAQLRVPAAHRRPVEAVWYVGRMMGETLAGTLTGMPTPYQPGIWFNSAKFFDIEYQTYGQVPANSLPGQQSLYWEHPKGRMALRIVFDVLTKVVRGCNALGCRQRHAVWEKWIEQQYTLPDVLNQLEDARFDEEFAYGYEPALREIAKHKGLHLQTTT